MSNHQFTWESKWETVKHNCDQGSVQILRNQFGGGVGQAKLLQLITIYREEVG